MGIGPRGKAIYEEMLPAFGRRASICDLGAQDIQEDGVILEPAGDYVRRRFGMDYTCIDLNGMNGSLTLDLNRCNARDVGKVFDVVTNHGTSEHCFDQANVFRLVHDLCKARGLMIHLVPHWPWDQDGDCFYWYSTNLFARLAEANQYGIERLEYFEEMGRPMVLAVLRQRATPAPPPLAFPMQLG